jgi:two-component system phosphate regulon response regulator PhoB
MKRVLIVEDQADIRELIRLTLEIADLDIHEAENGDLGLQMAQRLKPDLVLLDVMMPGTLDGFDVCTRIKSDQALKRMKVVMLSAKGQAADKEQGRQAGCDGYLTKPFSPKQLLDTLSRQLG